MKTRTFYMLLLIPILVGSLAFTAPRQELATNTDIAQHGTAWVKEGSGYKTFRAYGWGTATKAKTAATYLWAHMPFVYPTYLAGTQQKLAYIEFCAVSNNGAWSKPTHMDVYKGYSVTIYSANITWPADNNWHCVGHSFTPTWYEDVGLSVQLYFANTTDTITLYKAWIKVQP